MVSRLAARRRALVVVAGIASAQHEVMCSFDTRLPFGRDMTVSAIATHLEMGGRFSSGPPPIVTRQAAPRGALVVEMHDGPRSGNMAVLTGICRWQMPARFAGGFRAIMAAHAIVDNAGMVEHADSPSELLVAALAIIAGLDVVEGLARSMLPVMAAGAGQFGLVMVKLGNRPARRLVTVRAFIAGLDMGLVLSRRHIIVVAGDASARDRSMIDMHAGPHSGRMAIRAGAAGLGMVFRLACRHAAIVTARAGRWHAFENAARMAGFAGHSFVGAIQYKAGCGMVEIAVNLDDSIHFFSARQTTRKRHHRDKHHAGTQENCHLTDAQNIPLR